MRISDWSSDVCSSDLREFRIVEDTDQHRQVDAGDHADAVVVSELVGDVAGCRTECIGQNQYAIAGIKSLDHLARSKEHTSELKSLMRISYAVFCLNNKNQVTRQPNHTHLS